MRAWTLRRIATRTLENPRRIPFGFVRRPARSTTAPVGPDLLDGLLGGRGAGLGEPPARDLHRRGERGGAGRVGVVEHRAGGVADAAHALLGARRVVARLLELDRDVDDAAGVGDEVGRPDDAAV